MKNLIEVSHVSKSYGKVQALRDVSFSVKQGELFGLIGPDGAGKSTLFRILTTLLLPDQGSARVLDADVRADFRTIRQSVGYMPERFSLYQDLTVEENLRFFATVFHTTVEENYERIRAIYEQIAPFKQRRAAALSGGMKQKLAVLCIGSRPESPLSGRTDYRRRPRFTPGVLGDVSLPPAGRHYPCRIHSFHGRSLAMRPSGVSLRRRN